MEEPERFDEAAALRADALRRVEMILGDISHEPKMIFCSTQACFERFGFSRALAQTRGKSATVVGPRGWRPAVVRHELIHHWQADRLGLRRFAKLPVWLREGMAYDLSDDSGVALEEPMRSYRTDFRTWFATLPADVSLLQALRRVDVAEEGRRAGRT